MKLTKLGRSKLRGEVLEALKKGDGVRLVQYAVVYRREYAQTLKYIRQNNLISTEELLNASRQIREAQSEISKEEKRLNKKQLKEEKAQIRTEKIKKALKLDFFSKSTE